jgi:hypothetical protein
MLTNFLARLRALMQRRRVSRELDDELRFHIEMEAESNIKRGLLPVEAHRAALLDLGGIEQTKLKVRDVRAFSVEGIWQDSTPSESCGRGQALRLSSSRPLRLASA